MRLPPKRFQDPRDSKWDGIRHKPWFNRLLRRRAQIPALQQALEGILDRGLTQKQAAEEFKVDPRELRDYTAFRKGLPLNDSLMEMAVYQNILDSAYKAYCEHGALRHIRSFIEDIAPLYGVNARHVTELWETDPTFYPFDYQP